MVAKATWSMEISNGVSRLWWRNKLGLRRCSVLLEPCLSSSLGTTAPRVKLGPKGLRPRPEKREQRGSDMKDERVDGKDEEIRPPGEVGVKVVAHVIVKLGTHRGIIELVL
mmetsp:Transcript_18051/g.54397  ORF Transcript_18051/g.54397 Transcript_18051/m.54397 type:complete len:111 (+) Transcript_18051:354-686(+)